MGVKAIKRLGTIGRKANRDGDLRAITLCICVVSVKPDAIQQVPQMWPTDCVCQRRQREAGMGATTRFAMQNTFAAHHQHIQLVMRVGQHFFLAPVEQRVGQCARIGRDIFRVDFFRILLFAVGFAKCLKCLTRIVATGRRKAPRANRRANQLDRFGSGRKA